MFSIAVAAAWVGFYANVLSEQHTLFLFIQSPDHSGANSPQNQINGTRLGAPPTSGGANIEMGGSNANQLIEHVRSFDPRSWSCLHIAEGAFSCINTTVQHNDIGPCGSDLFQQWADGISVSCQNSLVRNNTVNNPTASRVLSLQTLIDAYRWVCSGWRYRPVRCARDTGGEQHDLGGDRASEPDVL